MDPVIIGNCRACCSGMVVAEDLVVNFYLSIRCRRKFQHIVAAQFDPAVFTKRVWFTLTWLLISGLIADI
jgi:hypothetical protein